MKPFIEYSKAVKMAMDEELPILALESTLITHGLPYPHNIETAIAVEKIARSIGVIPATIAIMQGKIKIGLSEDDLQILIQDKTAVKVSRRDIPYVLQQKINAGTTVAATMFCAKLAGIKLFSTGAIGGVHRGDSLDISADLIELSRIPLAVICSGAKSILDLPKTMELLETLSIPVIGYQTKQLPAFYSRESGLTVPSSIDNLTNLARILQIHWQLNPNTGVLITNPIPEENEIEYANIEPVIQQALEKANQTNITGKAITPYLLNEIVNATDGASLKANIALIQNNVRVGAELAKVMFTRNLARQDSMWQPNIFSL